MSISPMNNASRPCVSPPSEKQGGEDETVLINRLREKVDTLASFNESLRGEQQHLMAAFDEHKKGVDEILVKEKACSNSIQEIKESMRNLDVRIAELSGESFLYKVWRTVIAIPGNVAAFVYNLLQATKNMSSSFVKGVFRCLR